jgi:hypothetical protein
MARAGWRMARRGEGAAVGASVHAAPGVAFECSQRRAQHRASENLAHLRHESVCGVRVSAACQRCLPPRKRVWDEEPCGGRRDSPPPACLPLRPHSGAFACIADAACGWSARSPPASLSRRWCGAQTQACATFRRRSHQWRHAHEVCCLASGAQRHQQRKQLEHGGKSYGGDRLVRRERCRHLCQQHARRHGARRAAAPRGRVTPAWACSAAGGGG